MDETLLGVLLGIPPGIIGGIYAGLIVARYQRFADLRSEILRIIRAIDFIMDQDDQVQIKTNKDIADLLYIAGDFAFLRHKNAYMITATLSNEISDSNYQAKSGMLGYDKYSEKHKKWQQQARSISPNPFVLLWLWSGL